MLARYLEEAKAQVLEELVRLVPKNQYGPILYDLMLEYPLRSAKGLRPALCMAAARALGGRLEDVLPTAAVLELYHNAFLIHDDIEDGSISRRGFPTLHREYGVPIAINVGDAMLALALKPLLENMRSLGLAKAIRVLEGVYRMALASAEGQALELAWIRHRSWALHDADYWHLVYKKTCCYTFIAPMQIGALIAGASPVERAQLKRFATYLGVAFQIQDDVLNLEADEATYGKEIAGDLWEGKHTLMLMHAVRSATPEERAQSQQILAKERAQKSEEEVQFLLALIRRHDSVEYARRIGQAAAARAARVLAATAPWLPGSVHRDFLAEMVGYVTARDR